MRIAVVDLETTGFAPPEAAVCEFGFSDVLSCAFDLSGAPYDWYVSAPTNFLCNPGHPIPPETSAIHHIIDEDVAGAPSFHDIAAQVIRSDAVDIYAAHNAKFERQFITDEMTGGKPWICTYKCALRVWPDAPNHQNQTLRYWLNPFGISRQIASETHRAGPDAYVTAFTLAELLKLHPVDDLIQWSSAPAILPRVTVGMHRGKKWSEVDSGFIHWVLGKDFDEDVMHTARTEIERRSTMMAG